MPTAPDKTWPQLLALLDDNNVGAINEEDVRSIARFARASFAYAGASGVSNLGTWAGSIPATPTGTEPPRYAYLMALKSFYRGENYLSPSVTGFNYSGGGGATDTVAASRLVMFSWDIELFSTSLEHTAIAWWYLPSEATWPTGAKRHRIGRMYTQTAWNATTAGPAGIDQQFKRTAAGYTTASSGTGMVVLNPGDQLIPLLEHYGPGGSISGPLLSFDLNAVTTGVVDETVTIPSTYWDSVSYKDVDVDKPFTSTPLSPRLTGQPPA